VLYRGRLGRVYVLCALCQSDEQCRTARALSYFGVLLEQAHSVGALRKTMMERISDTVCPTWEKEVFAKLLAHAVPNAEGGTAHSPLGIHSSAHLSLSTASLSKKGAAHLSSSALSMSMLDSRGGGGGEDLGAGTAIGISSGFTEVPGNRLDKSVEGDVANSLLLKGALATQDELMKRYNALWRASTAEAARVSELNDTLGGLRAERDCLREDSRIKDASMLAGKQELVAAEALLMRDCERLEREREREVGLLRAQLEELRVLWSSQVRERKREEERETARDCVCVCVCERGRAAEEPVLVHTRTHTHNLSLSLWAQMEELRVLWNSQGYGCLCTCVCVYGFGAGGGK